MTDDEVVRQRQRHAFYARLYFIVKKRCDGHILTKDLQSGWIHADWNWNLEEENKSPEPNKYTYKHKERNWRFLFDPRTVRLAKSSTVLLLWAQFQVT